MSRLTQKGATGDIEVFTTSTDASLATLVGSRWESADGREFVLVQNGATALAAGKLVQSVPNTADHIGLTTVSFTAYSNNGNQPAQAVVTCGGLGVLPNEYAGGFAITSTGTGAGQTLRIAGNTGQTSTTGNTTITFENPEGQNMTALDATTTVSLFRNPYGSANGGTASTGAVTVSTNGVIINPTTTTGTIVGASVYPIAASTSTVATYGLIQTQGVAAMLNHSGTTIGLNVGNSTQSTPVAGAVETYAAASNILVGYAVQAGTSTDYNLVFLTL